jgi:hypothetical protein
MICRDFSHTAYPFTAFIDTASTFFLTFLIPSAKGPAEKFGGTGVAQVALHNIRNDWGDRKVTFSARGALTNYEI